MISWKKEIHLHLSQNVSEHMNRNEFVPLSNKYYDPDCTDLLSHPYNLYTYLLIHENYMMYTRQSTLNDQHQILLKTLFMKKENILHNHILFLNYKIGGKSMQLRRYPLADGSCQVHQKGAVYGKTTHLGGLIHTFFLPSAATSPHTEIKVCYMVPYKRLLLYMLILAHITLAEAGYSAHAKERIRKQTERLRRKKPANQRKVFCYRYRPA